MKERKKLPFIIVLGKPGSGKSWIAFRIAQKYKLRLLAPPTSKYTADQTSVEGSLRQTVESGPQLDSDNPFAMSEETSIVNPGPAINGQVNASVTDGNPSPVIEQKSPNVSQWLQQNKYKGVVVDGSIVKTNSQALQNLYETFEQYFSSSHKLLIINLEISDKSLLKRRLSQMIDPVSGLVYHEEQVLATPLDPVVPNSVVETQETDEPEAVDEGDGLPNMPFNFIEIEPCDLTDLERLIVFESGQKWMEDLILSNQDDDDLDLQMTKRKYQKYLHNQKYFDLMEKLSSVWKRIKMETRLRLIKRGEDDEKTIKEDFLNYRDINRVAENLLQKLPNQQSIRINVSQNPIAVLFMVKFWLDINCSRYTSLVEDAKPIDMPPELVKELPFEKAVLRLLEDRDEGLPPLKLGALGKYCIVTFVERKEKTLGNPEFSTAYKGFLFMFSSMEYKRKFEGAVDFYFSESLKSPPVASPLDIVDKEFYSSYGVYGYCKEYCPVHLSKSILKKGHFNLSACYDGSYYCFASDEARLEFLNNPDKYILDTSSKNLVSSPRIAITGASCSGKSTVYQRFASNLPLIEFPELVKKYLIELNDEEKQKHLQNLVDFSEEIPTESLDRIFSYARNVIESGKGYVLEGFPRNKTDMHYLLNNNLVGADLVVFLQVSYEISERRASNMISDCQIEEPKYDSAIRKDLLDRLNVSVDDAFSDIRIRESVEIISYDANKSLRKLQKEMQTLFDKFLARREAIFCQAYMISPENAEQMIANGIAESSSYGYLCPVTLAAKRRNIVNCIGSTPVMLFDKIFYCRDKLSAAEFVRDPLSYTQVRLPFEIESPIFSIVGAKNESMVKRIALDLNMRYIPVSQAYEIAKKYAEEFDFWTGSVDSLSDQERFNVMRWVFSQAVPWSQGVITGELFSSTEDYEKCSKIVMPWKIIELNSGILEDKLNNLRNSVDKEFVNVWRTFDNDVRTTRRIKQEIMDSTHARYIYKSAMDNNYAAMIFDAGIASKEVQNRISAFGLYCPVTYIDDKELIMTHDINYVVRYKEFVYGVLNHAAAEKFIANPARYTDTLKLPDDIPKRADSKDISKIAFKGYCAVSYSFGELIPGKIEFIAKYCSNIYAMISEEYLEKFLTAPWKYAQLVLPADIPPAANNASHYSALPLRSYIEETLSMTLNQALIHLADLKPKLPHETLKSSSMIFVALYLKGKFLSNIVL